MIKLPISYSGNKFKVLNELLPVFPTDIENFYEVFGGALTVGSNVKNKNIFYNDINIYLKEIIEYFYHEELSVILEQINYNIKLFNLKKSDKDSYYKLRTAYNTDRDIIKLFLLLVYGFQNQIRFNNNHLFNNPIGLNHYETEREKELISFIKGIKEKNISFYSSDFKTFIDFILSQEINNSEKLVYLDPPYLITSAAYNDGGKRGFSGWTEKEEISLLENISLLNENNIKFVLSNVIEHKEKENSLLKEWVESNNFELIDLKHFSRKEIIVKNF